MVTIEGSNSIHRINEAKVRRDHDEWHDVALPILDEDPDEQKLRHRKIPRKREMIPHRRRRDTGHPLPLQVQSLLIPYG